MLLLTSCALLRPHLHHNTRIMQFSSGYRREHGYKTCMGSAIVAAHCCRDGGGILLR
jgi:hypothetical protein